MKKKLSKSSQATLMMMILAGIAIISTSSYSIDEAMAFPHASLVIDPENEDANDIRVVLGHTNEPAYGKLPGIHDGKHNLEIDLSDNATTLPIPNATLFADKYYFKNIASFQRADSLEDADAIELNVPVTAVFGQSGTFVNRQVIDPGIYGYTIRGTIDYYEQAQVPLENTTKFCSIPGKDLIKFDSDGWTGSYGCPQNIKSIFFPPADKYPDNGYPPNQSPQYGDGYGDYQQKQYLDNNNYYDNVRDDSRDNRDDKKDDYKSDSRDNKRNDRNDEYKEYNDNNNDNYDDQYRYEYTDDDNDEYGNEYTSYDQEEEE
ncbi:MAG TPA: hypothetical protein VHJ38_09450 [Nitrososphaeraceae archaeon]|nr:hypothetical protein [Nitrososphaeraceae archaeon]